MRGKATVSARLNSNRAYIRSTKSLTVFFLKRRTNIIDGFNVGTFAQINKPEAHLVSPLGGRLLVDDSRLAAVIAMGGIGWICTP